VRATMKTRSAMIVSGGFPASGPNSNASQAWGPAPLRSGGELKDAATEETEGATTLTVATYRPAREILKNPDTGPHSLVYGD
jgi:hypothetical protein